jgi:DNA repair protein RecO
MAALASAAVNRSFWGIVEDWERVRYADHLLEIASELFPQAGAKPRAFEVLLRGMCSIADGEPPAETARRAEAEFLAIGGWGPDLSGCRKCGGQEGRSYRFLDSEGGVLCAACPPGGGVPLSFGAVKTWRALQAGRTAARGRLRIPVVIIEELRTVIPGYVEYCLGKRLRSLGKK